MNSAIAETGTLVLSGAGTRGLARAAGPHRPRAGREEVLALIDLWKPGATPAAMPASVVLVSGPSKTADIEGILITGVHGPREVHILVINADP